MTAEDIWERIEKLLEQHGWTVYRLAKESGLPNSTVYNIKNRGSFPKHDTLEDICEAFHVTVADFLEEKKPDLILTKEDKRLIKQFRTLSPGQKERVLAYVDAIVDENKTGKK